MRLNPGDGTGKAFDETGVTPGSIFGVKEDGSTGWIKNFPTLHLGAVCAYDLGALHTSTNLDGYNFTIQSSNHTKVHTAFDGDHECALTIGDNSNAAGRIAAILHSATPTMIALSSDSGTWTYETVFYIPTLSAGLQNFVVRLGFIDSVTGASVDGAWMEIASHTDGQMQCKTSANSVVTTTASGVTISAATWYRARIVVTNDTSVSFYLAADGALGAAVATHTTNIPTGAGREFGAGIQYNKTAGTTARTVSYTYQFCSRDPNYTAGVSHRAHGFGSLTAGDGAGAPLGPVGSDLRYTENGVRFQESVKHPARALRVHVMEVPGQTPTSVQNDSSAAMTGAALSNYLTTCSVGINGSGTFTHRSLAGASYTPSITFDANSDTWVYEQVFQITTLSTAAQAHVYRFGFIDSANTAAPVDGAWMEIDSNADAQMQCKTSANSVVTTTDSGVTINAATYYYARIVVTADSSVSFYLSALDADATGAAVATHTTNIPSGSARATSAGMTFHKSAGVTARTANCNFQHVYQLAA